MNSPELTKRSTDCLIQRGPAIPTTLFSKLCTNLGQSRLIFNFRQEKTKYLIEKNIRKLEMKV